MAKRAYLYGLTHQVIQGFHAPLDRQPTDEYGFQAAHGSTGCSRAPWNPFALRPAQDRRAIFRERREVTEESKSREFKTS